jgi:transcriptional regulator with XRE-family HTH domain
VKCPRCDGTGELYGNDALFTAIGLNIARIRTDKGLSQHDLANKIKVGRTQIANMEMGRGVGSIGTVNEIAQALGVELGELTKVSQ